MKLEQCGLNALSMHSVPGAMVSGVQTTRTHYFSLRVHQKLALMIPSTVHATVPNQSHRGGAMLRSRIKKGFLEEAWELSSDGQRGYFNS